MTTTPRIAIPVPHSSDPEYAGRALPQYEAAVRLAGGEPVAIALERTPAEIMKQIERCDAVLLPGSKADVDPAKYGAERHEKTAASDPKRDTVDELLLQDAYNMRKPVLAICYGMQTLNVYRTGTLVQHLESVVNHTAGRTVVIAHQAKIEPGTRLAKILGSGSRIIPVNSSHHQAADIAGDGLRVAARCPEDGVIEALEGTALGHFVLAVQWHPERLVREDGEVGEPAKAVLQAFVDEARVWHTRMAGEFETAGHE